MALCLLRPSTFTSQSTLGFCCWVFFFFWGGTLFETDARQGSGCCQLLKKCVPVCPQALGVTHVCPRVFHVGREFQLSTGSLMRDEADRATLHPVSKQLPFLRQRCCLCRLFAPRLLLPLLGLPPMMKFGLQHPLPPVPAGLIQSTLSSGNQGNPCLFCNTPCETGSKGCREGQTGVQGGPGTQVKNKSGKFLWVRKAPGTMDLLFPSDSHCSKTQTFQSGKGHRDHCPVSMSPALLTYPVSLHASALLISTLPPSP